MCPSWNLNEKSCNTICSYYMVRSGFDKHTPADRLTSCNFHCFFGRSCIRRQRDIHRRCWWNQGWAKMFVSKITQLWRTRDFQPMIKLNPSEFIFGRNQVFQEITEKETLPSPGWRHGHFVQSACFLQSPTRSCSECRLQFSISKTI